MKIDSKKAIFALSISLCWPNYAAELSCSSYHTESITGMALHDNGGIIIGSLGNKSIFETYQIGKYQAAVVFPTKWQSEALDGNYILLVRTLVNGLVIRHSLGKIQTGLMTYSIEVPCEDCHTLLENSRLVVSGDINETTPPFIKPVPSQETSLSASTMFTVTKFDNTIKDNVETKLTFNSSLKKTDSIVIPDSINLGNLDFGHNTSQNSIDYVINSNSIGLRFISGSNPNSYLTVNEKRNNVNEEYRPPFQLGMYLDDNTNPGTYKTTVNATWTCP
ncbi:hypothetical protein [Enterobacter asburiae]|uniref:hypothetical protein n=1 Tax=Enterobacter asburiae TaxID=61645 RepID=UPI00210D58A2|nr:hypothetical protein [Enterobacter asburiae]MCQ4369183.1 hypothetical protein [Enterobacter asburiae]HDC4619758.1 hypothetical protein [Enterobacter asburiae]